MMKIRSILLFLALSIGIVNAQDGKKVNMGLSISPTFGGFEVDNAHYESNGTKAGLSYGLLTDFRLFETDNYRFATGICFTSINGKLNYPDVASISDSNYSATNESTISTRYVTVPLAIRLITSEIGYMKYYGLFGGELGFLTQARADKNLITDTETLSFQGGDIRSDFHSIRAALVFGAGIERYISGNTRIMAGLHYSSGITNSYDGKAFLTDDTGEIIFDDNNEPIEDRDIRSRTNYLLLNIAIFF